MAPRCLLAFLGAAWLALLAPPAAAEMYRCQTPDGSVLYTSDASQCPGAVAHEPAGRVHSVEGPAVVPSPRPGPAAEAAALDDDAAAAGWRQRKREAEARLVELRRAKDALYRAVGWCNRGYELWRQDDTGLRHDVSCDQVRARQDALADEERALQAYLEEGGLEDECRRSGCLPGWIRD